MMNANMPLSLLQHLSVSLLHWNVLLILLLVFSKSLVATLEIRAIALARIKPAMLLAGLNCLGYFVTTVVLIEAPNRLLLLVPYILGDVIAAAVGIKLSRSRRFDNSNL